MTERGWSSSDHWVCPDCVADDYLKVALAQAADEDEECSFCLRESAAPLDALMELLMVGILRDYEKAENVLYWADDVTLRYSSTDVVWDFSEVLAGEGLVEAVLESIHEDDWVPTDFAVPHDGDALRVAWEEFCQAVKFETRFVIWLRQPDPYSGSGDIPVTKVLEAVGDVVERLDLVATHPVRERWWRAQVHDAAGIEHTPTRLGTVPASLAVQPNRMSPPGIPHFYGASDPPTAVAEVAQGGTATDATWGAFETSRATRLVDFTNLPPVPSLFDPERGGDHYVLRFLHTFARQLSDKVRPDWEAVDYVPTQILTEYFLRVYEDPDGSIDGLIYKSAVCDGTCIVLDVRNEGCVMDGRRLEDPDGLLQLGLIAGTVTSAPLK